MYQRWHHLLFLHWPVPVDMVRPHIPPELTVDTWDGTAWIGLVPFTMSGIRWPRIPALPGISAFHETNVRTYVHCDGADPGVWFFSLDAATSLGVRAARRWWSLPYYRAAMSLRRRGTQIEYRSRRLWPGPPGAGHVIVADTGSPADVAHTDAAGRAIPGSLEHFLIERYFLYTVTAAGRLVRGQVHHAPYPLRGARVTHLKETMLRAAGLPATGEPRHVVFSEGVAVEVFRLRLVGEPVEVAMAAPPLP
jgi:uncharacterized protein YqjF (DUF2071 family)